MNSLETYILGKFNKNDFMKYQKARVLIYFLLVAAILLVMILVLTNLFVEHTLFSARNLMRVILLGVALIALFMIRGGNYELAANFIIATSTLTFGIQTMFDSFASPAEVTIRVLYLYIFVFIAAVFGSKSSTLATGALLFAIFGVLVYRNTGILEGETKSLVISFSATLLFITTLAFLMLSIVENTFKKITENDEKEKQHAALARIVSTVQNVSDELSDLSESFIQENRSLSERTLDQAASVEEIAASVEEISESVRSSAAQSAQIRAMAADSAKSAAEGVDLVKQVIVSIEQIEHSSAKIADIIELINAISFNTNLLALNAAVEAARAGESGRGFAVVAGEVRNLAQRAASASAEISSLVKESLSAVQNGSRYVRKSGEFITSISASVSGVSRGIHEIADSLGEQKSGMDQVNAAVMEIDSSTQQNSALVEKNVTIGSEISELVGTLHKLLNEARTQ